MPNDPPLTWLRSFEAAGRLGSFTAAAAELGLTQAAVSQQMRLLEARIGVGLFTRLARGVALTPEGAAYLPHVQAGFRTLFQSTEELFGSRRSRTLRLRSPISFATLWLAPRLPAFFARFPRTLFEIETIHTPADYGPGPVFDIRFGTGSFPGRISHRLSWERLVPVAAWPGPAAQAWAALPLLCVLGARELWPDWFAFSGLAPPRRTVLRCDSFVVAFEAARAGAGILLGSRPLIDRALAAGELHALSGVERPSNAGHFITYPDTATLTAEERDILDWWLRSGATP